MIVVVITSIVTGIVATVVVIIVTIIIGISCLLLKNCTDGFKQIVQKEGFKGLYVGIVPALWLTSHGAIHFVSYDKLKSFYTRSFSPRNSSAQLVGRWRCLNTFAHLLHTLVLHLESSRISHHWWGYQDTGSSCHISTTSDQNSSAR